MEELLDPGVEMLETLRRRTSLKGSFQSDSLSVPDTDFMTDDRSSAASGVDVADRLTYLEQRMQMQEEEIQLLKMALADVLQRLNISKEDTGGGRRAPAAKAARPVSLALPSKPPSTAPLKKSSTVPSSSTARNYSPTPPRSGARSPSGSVKDALYGSTKPRPASAASTCKKIPESKSKEAAAGAGSRRVTHCKVTMQIYLSPLAKKTGSSEAVGSAVPAHRGPTDVSGLKNGSNKPAMKKSTPSFTLNFQKSSTGPSTQQDTPSYKSPIKSPSQYFQICY
ncbi:echinoderm microtubule-associated protein-like 1 isoform X2 [Austrofundulus limnaeus]|uniref:Echinoderm microtubule-associated protein-like 1 isoform X2 n=1 Tax=Austrofundulus limnaeus TaxID=52670 RepID=A0A2I4BC90_AUSLI|nr:PREDICTED: echinoderm microtubule-associated protein-like 1 isoform X2 [Austrofundulus limnaeus]